MYLAYNEAIDSTDKCTPAANTNDLKSFTNLLQQWQLLVEWVK